MDRYIVAACDGNAGAGRIVEAATSVRRMAALLARVPRVSDGDLRILEQRAAALRALVESAELLGTPG